MSDRKVSIETIKPDSELLCNLKLKDDNGVHIVGFTRKEAESAYKLLGEALQWQKKN